MCVGVGVGSVRYPSRQSLREPEAEHIGPASLSRLAWRWPLSWLLGEERPAPPNYFRTVIADPRTCASAAIAAIAPYVAHAISNVPKEKGCWTSACWCAIGELCGVCGY